MTKESCQDLLLKRIKALEEKIETYQVLVENSPDLLYRTDLEGRITFVSSSVCKLSGYTVDEAVGMKMAEEIYLVPEERHAFLTQLQSRGRVSNFEARLSRKDGSTWWASTNAHFQRDSSGNIVGVEGVTRDISQIKAAENALRESEEQFRKAFKTSPDAINLNRVEDGHYIDINEGFTKITGYSRADVIGKSSLELNIWKHPEDRQRLLEGLRRSGYVENLEAEFVGKTGKTIIGLMSARFLSIKDEEVILTITRDITQHKKMAEQLQQAQKFEAMATLAGGVAHDFNNLLMGIQGRASLVLADIGGSHPHAEHMRAIEDHVRSATDLTRQLLGFARGGKYEVTTFDINELLSKSATMFGRTKKEIRIHTRLESPPPALEADRSQIEQVLLNMYVNAWQAMPDGGEMILQTRTVDLDASFCEPYRAAPGRFVKISVTDTGIGMDAFTRRKIFDPFFTTKGKGRGTGLGLASAYGIIDNHDGIITVYSEPGHGTTFNIYLPLSEKTPCGETCKREDIASGSGTVLLVDDEEIIRRVGQAMLERLGYRVITAAGGEQSLDIVNRMGSEIDLVILDLIMPDMNGKKVYESLVRIRPDIRVLLSSGYAMNGDVEAVLNSGCNGFIQKPFNLADLSRKIAALLKPPGTSR